MLIARFYALDSTPTIGHAVTTTPRTTQSEELQHPLGEIRDWAESPSKWSDRPGDRMGGGFNRVDHLTEGGMGTTVDNPSQDACLEFRVRRDGQPTRRLRLAGARYTLGSGVGCSIRLNDPALRPLHAVLIRDHGRVLVRAYSVPLQINDARVTEGVLELHDRLRMGQYEFELLAHTPIPLERSPQPVKRSSGSRESNASSSQAELASANSDDSSIETERQEWMRAFREDAKHWRALKQDVQQRDQWCRHRESELEEQRQSIEQQLGLLQTRQDEMESQESAALEVHEEFQQRFKDLTHRQEKLELQENELNAGREQLRLQKERLDGRDRLHQTQIEKLLYEQERFKEQESVHKEIIADAREQLAASHKRAEAATNSVDRMRKKFASLNEQLLQLTQQQKTLQQLESERNDAHQLRCDALATERDQARSERDEIASQYDEMASDRDEIASQHDQSVTDRDEFAMQRDSLSLQLAESVKHRDEAKQQRDEAKQQRDDAIDAKAQSEIRRETVLMRCDQLEAVEVQLRAQIQDLQDEIASVRDQAGELDDQCRSARETISRLESTIRTSEQRHEVDRESWTHEVETLCQSIDDLTLELAAAQSRLSQLRDDNDRLAKQLSGAHRDRDDARQKQEAATRECVAANLACDEAKAEIENARQQLADALQQCDIARQQREEVHAERDRISRNLVASDEQLDQWKQRTEAAERQYADARSLLAEARDQWQKAEHARDDAETQRELAERKLAEAQSEIETLQVERDNAVNEFEELRQQRDAALQDVDETRRMYDRSNRDHDATLDRIEMLEQQTRDVIEQKKKIATNGPVLIAENERPFGIGPVADDVAQPHCEPVDLLVDRIADEDVWPTYSTDNQTPAWSDDPEDHGVEVDVDDYDVNESFADNNDSTSAYGVAVTDTDKDADAQESLGDRLLREMGMSKNSVSHLSETEPEMQMELEPEMEAGPHPEASLFSAAMFSAAIDDEPVVPNSWIKPAIPDAFEQDYSESHPSNFVDDESDDQPDDAMISATAQWQPGASSPIADRFDETDATATHEPNFGVPIEDHADMKSEPDTKMHLGVEAPQFGEAESVEPGPLIHADSDEEPSSGLEAISVKTSTEHSPGDGQAGDGDSANDDSIEAYMNRLLQRVQGQSSSSQSPAATSSKPVPAAVSTPSSNSSPKKAKPESTQVVDDESADVAPGLDDTGDEFDSETDLDAPMVPRSQAPERSRDLSAMRALANESARSAIKRSNKSQSANTRVQAMLKFIYAGIALICGLIAVAMIELTMLKIIAVIAALVAAGIFVKEGFSLMMQLNVRAQRTSPPPASTLTASELSD